MIGVRGYLSGCILALAACIGLAVPVLAQDNSGLAAGKESWARAACSTCHGSMPLIELDPPTVRPTGMMTERPLTFADGSVLNCQV